VLEEFFELKHPKHLIKAFTNPRGYFVILALSMGKVLKNLRIS